MRFRLRPSPRLAEPTERAGSAGYAPTSPRRWTHPLRLRPPMRRRSDLDLPLPNSPRLEPPDLDPPALEPPTSWRYDAEPPTAPVDMWQDPPRHWPDSAGPIGADERLRPLYARALGLRHLEPGGLLCFLFFEGTVVLGFLLALAELVSWWGVLMLPASVALMVKINDAVAVAVARSAARVPELEQQRFRRELQPAVGRAVVPRSCRVWPAGPAEYATRPPGFGDHAVSTVARVRPELAPVRARPRPLSAVAPEEWTGHGPAQPAASAEPAGSTTGPDWPELGDAPPVRRSRNTHPVDRGRRAPTYLPDRRDPTGSAEHWVRQSARQRYGFD